MGGRDKPGHDGRGWDRRAVPWLAAALGALVTAALAPAAHAAGGDFALGPNAEKQACRAVERFDAPKGGAAVDLYCGAWEQPSGFLVLAPAEAQAQALHRLGATCAGPETVIVSPDFTELRQIACGGGAAASVRRYGVSARRGTQVLIGEAYPADWGPMMAAAKVLVGAAARTAVAKGEQAPPGLREIEAVYPQGVPGQGAELNYELLRRRAFERNAAWSFASAEQDFEALLRAHDVVDPDDAEGRAEILAEIGLNLSNAGRFEEAGETLGRAAALAQSAGATLLASKIVNYRALDLLNQHRYAAARDLALSANKMRAAPRASAGGAAISATDARVVDRATPAAARVSLLELDSASAEERSAILSAQGYFIAGVACRALGDGEAQTWLADASGEILRARSPPAWLTAAIADEEAQVRLAAGDAAGAAARAQAGLTQVRLVAPQTRGEAHLLLTLGRAQAALGQSAAALESGRAAMRIFARQLEQPGLPADLASGQLRLLLDEWTRSQTPQAAAEYFETLALTWDGAAARSAAQLAARLALRDSGAQARGYQDAERSNRAAVAERQRLGLDPATPAEKIAAADAAVDESARRLAAAEADLRSRAPGYLELLNPGVSTAELQGALGDKEGYLRIVTAPDGGFGALVTAAGVHPFAIALSGSQVEALAGKIRRTTSFRGRRLPTYDIAAASQLYAAVIGPVAADVAGLDRLDIDVSGALASVPFAALVETPPTEEAAGKVADEQDYSKIDWLARRVAIAGALGPASFVRFRKSHAQAQPARSLAAFGDFRPQPTEVAARLATANGLTALCQGQVARTLATLGPLPDTADEATQVAKAFPGQSRVRLGAAFTDADFMTSPDVSAADVILIATHGVLNLSSCFAEPSLLTSLGPTGDGLIEASGVLDRRLEARLVILSACDTAGGGRLDVTRSGLAGGGEALSGLVRGFLYAGVADVLATEWKVDSATSAAEVTSYLTAASKPGVSLASALATAQKGLYDSAETGHPFYWAAFILVGDGDVQIGGPAAAHAP